MKKLYKILVGTLICCAITTSFIGCGGNADNNVDVSRTNNWTVLSPDGSIASEISFDSQTGLSYSVKKDDTTVIEKSGLGFEIKEDDFDLLTVQNVGHRRVKGTYANVTGKSKEVEYDCNETVITLKGWKFYLDLTMRAYDDGYAFKYDIRAIDGGTGTITVLSENSEFALPDNTPMWTMPYRSTVPSRGEYFSYEAAYNRRTSTTVENEILSLPLLYQIRNKDVYSLITESALIGSGYYGSFITEPTGKSGTGVFQTVHTPAGKAENDNVVAYPFTSPWRVGITGTLKTVQESELVEKLYDNTEVWTPDDYEGDSAEYYDWVEPGVSAWSWLLYQNTRGQNDWGLQYEYLDLAEAMGWKYTILDGGWTDGLNEDTMRTFTADAHNRGIKVIVWCDAMTDFGNGKFNVLQAKLDVYKSYGVDGIKIDFFDGLNAHNNQHQGEDIDTIKWYESIYQECAKRQMVVNCHGCNKPTGERRIYPNVINREGIYGNENLTIGSSVVVNQLFVRSVIGPSDFTPVVTPLSEGMTMAQQMALAVLFESGQPSMADYTNTYLKNSDIIDFYKSIPSLRDETVFLCGELDGYYVAAVRAGDDWFVAGANSTSPNQIKLDFSFLGSGEYEANVFLNDEQDRNVITKTVKTITKDSKEDVAMIKNGGFVYHLKLKK